MSSEMTQEEYDKRVQELDHWANQQYDQAGAVDPLLIILCSLALSLVLIVVGYCLDGTWTDLLGM
jgi:hypothetical protein